MKRIITMAFALAASIIAAKAQFSIGINAGLNTPQRSVTDSLSILRPGYSIYLDPAYTFGKFTVNSKLGYQAFNLKSGFNNLIRQRNYNVANGYNIVSNSPGLFNIALGGGYNLLPAGSSACGLPMPSLLIGAQFGVLKTVDAAKFSVAYQGKETAYALLQSDKTLPYINTGIQIIYPVTGSISLKSGITYNATLSDMSFKQTSNGQVATISTGYSDIQFTIGIQFSFTSMVQKSKNGAMTGAQDNPLYNNGAKVQSSGQPIGGIVVAGHGPHAKVTGQPIGGIVVSSPHPTSGNMNDAQPVSPLHEGSTTSGDNPLFDPKAKVAGQPIGGIVVAGHGPHAKVAGQPIGGIVVSSPHPTSGNMNDVQPVSPLHEGSTTSGENPLFDPKAKVAGQPIGGIVVAGHGPHAVVTGNPIPGVVVKGGKTPGAIITVLDNGKSISEKGIKRSADAEDLTIPNANGKGITEKGIKRNADAEALTVPDVNGKGIQEKGMKFKVIANNPENPAVKSKSLVYTDDFMVEDAELLKQLGVTKLIIQKGEYVFNYRNNPDGEVTLKLKATSIIHRDLAVRNLVFKGSDPQTGSVIDYTIEPVFNKGVANKITISYKGITEKGIK